MVSQLELEALQDRLCLALYRASHAMTATYRQLLQPLDLTYPQYVVLSALWQEEGLTVKALAEVLAIDYGTISPLLKRLELKGLIRRQRSSADERAVVVHLQPAGRELSRHATSIDARVCEDVGLDRHQRDALVAQLHDVSARLSAETSV